MTEWYYRDAQSQKIGPLSTDEFEERVTDGEIQAHTRVWRSGLLDWTTYEALLAKEACGLLLLSCPVTDATPQSRSRRSGLSSGVSPVHCPPGESQHLSSEVAPYIALAPTFELCPGCHEEMPSQFFREVGHRRVCASCVRHAQVARNRRRAAQGSDASWLGRYFVRLALVAGAFVAIRIVLLEMGGGDTTATPSPTAVEVHPDLRFAPPAEH